MLAEVRACRLCAEHLPLGPRPVLQAGPTARLLVVGQAPGTRVHATGIPWNDASGERLRRWLGLEPAVFYDPSRVAIVPMGFCYPGRLPRGGDRPPRPECAATWHARLLANLPAIELTLLIGSFAVRHYLAPEPAPLMDIVRRADVAVAQHIPLPHPSPRNQNLFKRNPWFEAETIPKLQARLAELGLAAKGKG
ncbi:MAG: uracil-DNA glycosylase family protein [Geminicoccaceae bacterium]|nr:MAG: uracil-DNA glycosylase family protein [Geminicoccaceae bacterium]